MGFTTDDACANIYKTGGGAFPSVSYSAIASATGPGQNAALNEFVNTGYVIGTPAGGNDEVVKYFSGKGPANFSAKPNVVTYLGYPVNMPPASFSLPPPPPPPVPCPTTPPPPPTPTIVNRSPQTSTIADYRTNPLTPTDFITIIQAIINDGNLISELQLYNPADFQTTPSSGGSLIYLYQAVSKQKEIDALLSVNLNFFGVVMAEYCYYKRLYTYLLNRYFLVYNYSSYTANGPDIGIGAIGGITATAANGPQSAASPTQTVQALNLSQIAYYLACINSRLVDINGLLTAVNAFYTNALSQLAAKLDSDGNVFGSQQDVEKRLVALNASTLLVKKFQSEADYRKGIIQYTEEKNRYSNILLGLYAFLNIAAIGVILNLRE